LPKVYHTIQQWDNWLNKHPGLSVLEAEQNILASLLSKNHGKNLLLIGAPSQYCLFKDAAPNYKVILSPLINKYKHIKYIECGFHELSILSGSVDTVILPHTLEFIDFPRQLLTEACRVIKPGGNIIIMGFNPCSLWGFKKGWGKNKMMPWSGHFIFPHIIKKWLNLLDFEFIRKDMLMFRPPLQNPKIFNKLKFLEWIGRKGNVFFGGIYAITAKAKVIPLTPIRLHWEQTLPRLSISVPGPTMRDLSQ
jgi:SAM-dependent methyltransferase